MTHVSTLGTAGLGYLATPYTKYPDGIESAYVEACKLSGELMRHGLGFISPIAHGHGIAKHGAIEPLNHDLWLRFDEALMEAAHYLLVAEMRSWEKSYGVHKEIMWFTQNHKDIYYLDPIRLLVSSTPLACALPDPKEAA